MTNEEIVKTLEIAKAEVEWDYPLDYQIAFDAAIKIIKEREELEKNLEKLREYASDPSYSLDSDDYLFIMKTLGLPRK